MRIIGCHPGFLEYVIRAHAEIAPPLVVQRRVLVCVQGQTCRTPAAERRSLGVDLDTARCGANNVLYAYGFCAHHVASGVHSLHEEDNEDMLSLKICSWSYFSGIPAGSRKTMPTRSSPRVSSNVPVEGRCVSRADARIRQAVEPSGSAALIFVIKVPTAVRKLSKAVPNICRTLLFVPSRLHTKHS